MLVREIHLFQGLQMLLLTVGLMRLQLLDVALQAVVLLDQILVVGSVSDGVFVDLDASLCDVHLQFVSFLF